MTRVLRGGIEAVQQSNGRERNDYPTYSGGRGWSGRASTAVAVGSWLCLGATLSLWLLLHLGDLWWPATLLMFSPRWLLIVPPSFLLLAAALLRRRMMGVLLLNLLLIVGPIMGFCFSWSASEMESTSARSLRLMTCNAHHQKPDIHRFKKLLAEARPDIVVVQEWPGSAQAEVFPASEWHVHKVYGLFLASRFPIRGSTQLGEDSMDEVGLVIRYELDAPAAPITLFSLHLASPREGLYQATHHPWKGVDDLDEGSTVRWAQCGNLARAAEEASGPVLLAGDFNTPSESAIFRRLWPRYTDAFSSAGFGWGYTFFGGRTAVRIDHILASPGWRCERCWVRSSIGSPHHPVLADLTWLGSSQGR